jgi:hypothetical protein
MGETTHGKTCENNTGEPIEGFDRLVAQNGCGSLRAARKRMSLPICAFVMY